MSAKRPLDVSRKYLLLLFLLVLLLSFVFYTYLGRSIVQVVQKSAFVVKPLHIANIANPPDPVTRNNVNKTILLWTPFFGKKDYIGRTIDYRCDVSNCVFTSDRSQLNASDAVMLHLRDVRLSDLPTFRTPDQRWVLLHHESPPHTPRDIVKGLDGKINWTITYRLDSDMVLQPQYVRKTSPSNVVIDYAANKTRMIAWFVSNCHTPSRREDYVSELRKVVPVDVYGDCGEHRCVPKMSAKCYKDAAKEYRFYLSFENSLCKDYVTEKLFAPMRQDIVPIVFGGANYSLFAPPESYINTASFSSPRALGKYLIRLAQDKNRQAYNHYLKWKNFYAETYDSYVCQLCRKLNDLREKPKTWHNLESWWFDASQCKQWIPPSKPWL